MHKTFKIMGISVLLVLIIMVGSNLNAYAVNGHGTSYGPSFGGGIGGGILSHTYSDGLKINGKAFDISKFSQEIPTQKLYVNDPSYIQIKIFDNSGPKSISHVMLFLNMGVSSTSVSDSDTWLEYDVNYGVSIHDPHHLFKNVKVDVSYDDNFMYVTFSITPQSVMDTSHMIVRAWDFRLSSADATILNAIKISYLPPSFSR